MEIIDKTKKMCQDNNAELLYLVKFGSHLYGTNTEKSDEDYKGIFLPSINDCILQKAPKSINYSTGKEKGKNTKDDTDIQLWSLQYFLELLSKGEVNALDLAYSFTHEDIVVYCRFEFERQFFPNIKKFFNIKDCNAFVGYAIGQAKKYGIKGSRLGKIKDIIDYMTEFFSRYGTNKVTPIRNQVMREIDNKFHDDSYCFIKEKNETRFLVICGRMHQESILTTELYERLKSHYESYGERSELARQNKGLDYKALSHALRCLYQMEELLETGQIIFPLKDVEAIMQVKQGCLDFNEIEAIINNKINKIKGILANYSYKTKDNKFIERFILNMYDKIKGGSYV